VRPFVELEDHKIEQKHAAGEFLPLDGVVDGVSGLVGLWRVIGKCWEEWSAGREATVRDLEKLLRWVHGY
jgi:hypothetical protein